MAIQNDARVHNDRGHRGQAICRSGGAIHTPSLRPAALFTAMAASITVASYPSLHLMLTARCGAMRQQHAPTLQTRSGGTASAKSPREHTDSNLKPDQVVQRAFSFSTHLIISHLYVRCF